MAEAGAGGRMGMRRWRRVALRNLAMGWCALTLVPRWADAQPVSGAKSDPVAPGRSSPDAGALRVVEALGEVFSGVYDRVASSVVVVRVSRPVAVGGADPASSPPPAGSDAGEAKVLGEKRSEGTGFVVSAAGHIYTNRHVVADAGEISVRLRDGRDLAAGVVGSDELTDVAVLKVDGERLPTVELGDSERVRVGQIVCAIGTPYNLDQSFTFGCVSATGRGDLHQANYEDYIQTDASINPGNSGGPLLDVRGRVIGMNTLINGLYRGLGFAIPINLVDQVGRQLIERGRVVRPWIGVGIRCALADHPDRAGFGELSDGLMITVEADGPAHRAGLRGSDVILEIDGRRVRNGRDLQKSILNRAVGDRVTLVVWRAGRREKIEVVTGEFPTGAPRAAAGAAP